MSRAVKLLAGALLLTMSTMGLIAIAAADDMAAPSGVKGEIMMSMKDAESKLVQLAEATPEGKYAWRPSKGVRSTGEVFAHVAASNYGMPTMAGVPAPEGVKMETYEKSMTKKADIVKALKDSFAYMEEKFMAMPDADMDRTVDVVGHPMSVRAMYIMVAGHCHEHLGQSIAYARSNGITPPWSAEQDAAFKKWMESRQKAQN